MDAQLWRSTVPQEKFRADRKRQKQYAKKKRQAAKRKNAIAPLQQRELPRVPMVFWVMALTSHLVLCTMDVLPIAALRTWLVKSIGMARCFVQWPSVPVREVLSRTLAHEEAKIEGKSARRKARKNGTKLQARHIHRSRRHARQPQACCFYDRSFVLPTRCRLTSRPCWRRPGRRAPTSRPRP